jgi:magnesium chelatase subunit D
MLTASDADDDMAGVGPDAWTDAACAAALLAIDPIGLGGVVLRSPAGAVRERWLTLLRQLLPQGAPFKRMPLHIHDERLLGGLDLAATLQAGRPVAQRGLLAEADGGLLLLAMAERLSAATAAKLGAAMDTGEVVLERDGLALRRDARFGVVALDEGNEPEERVPAALADRLAFQLELPARVPGDSPDELTLWRADDIAAARAALPRVTASHEMLEALCAAALALGIGSARAPLLALRAARAAASLDGRTQVGSDDAALAARLVLAPRATRLPPAQPEGDEAPPENEDATPEEPPPEPPDSDGQDETAEPPPAGPIDDLVLESARAAIPAGLLAALAAGQAPRASASAAGRSGEAQQGQRRGRPMGARRGEPRGGARLDLIATLRAAAPWQPLRRRERALQTLAGSRTPRIEVRRDDFHITRYRERRETTTIFAVDASGSSALNRLAEAKGAVELLLADCYVRRDRVALLAFRGAGCELLLPPTRSLVRAKRGLAGLPGGGGTPLAAGIDAAAALADAVRRRGETAVVVMLTDGRANVGRGGIGGRERAMADAMSAAQQLATMGLSVLLLDTSPQPQAAAQLLAQAMGARYLPLPYAGAAEVSLAVRAATAASARTR